MIVILSSYPPQFEASQSGEGQDDVHGDFAESEASLPLARALLLK